MVNWIEIEQRVLAGLQPFQRRTVEWAFACLFGTDGRPSTGRFLVADEVGLGKTVVAKGIIAKAVPRLLSKLGRVDIVYVCSNASIAKQNLARLDIGLGKEAFTSQSRLTLLPLIPIDPESKRPVRDSALNEKGINFVSLTPGTSLELSGDVGQSHERALLCLMLSDRLPGVSDAQLKNLFAARVRPDIFRRRISHTEQNFKIDPGLREKFVSRLSEAVADGTEGLTLLQQVAVLAERHQRERPKNFNADTQDRELVHRLIGQLRVELARICVDALEPDLIILDEFQRFADLLKPGTPDAELAHQFLNYENADHPARILLLSATPYRLCTAGDQAGDSEAYQEFLDTAAFLMRHNSDELGSLKSALRNYNEKLRHLKSSDLSEIIAAKHRVEGALTRYIARTDRVPTSEDRDAMVYVPNKAVAPNTDDLTCFAALHRVAQHLGEPDLTEYWRSAAYPLSFLSGYKLRDRLDNRLKGGDTELQTLLQQPGLLLPAQGDLRHSAPLEIPRNARARWLANELIASGLHKVLWIPPSLPHYSLSGPYAELKGDGRTKRLVFSSWRMVPRSLSTVLDAALHRAAVIEAGTIEIRQHTWAKADLALIYPCSTLASRYAPSALAASQGIRGEATDFETLVSRVATSLEDLLYHLDRSYGQDNANVDHNWYWMAPVLMDVEATQGINASELHDLLSEKGWSDRHGRPSDVATASDELQNYLQGGARMGKMPADLADVMARIALAGPGTCALRAMATSQDCFERSAPRKAALQIGVGLYAYCSSEHAVAVIRAASDREEYWRRVLLHSGQGCLQAVLDEYVAVLRMDKADIRTASDPDGALAEAACNVLRLRPATLRPDGWIGKQLEPMSATLRICRPLLEDKGLIEDHAEQDSEGATKKTRPIQSPMDMLRDAFNSPFMPFVLSSTSIGQEGLDFHWYCHAIIHWNLPANPVDFEQRDGRIHRYRNHAVRRNIARDWGADWLLAQQSGASSGLGGVEAWETLFKLADNCLAERNSQMDGISPSWIYQARKDGDVELDSPGWFYENLGAPASIERHIPSIPLSRDSAQAEELKRAVGRYRMVFAQPRQDDLLAHLHRTFDGIPESEVARIGREVSIDLRPPVVGIQASSCKANGSTRSPPGMVRGASAQADSAI